MNETEIDGKMKHLIQPSRTSEYHKFKKTNSGLDLF